MTAGQPPGVPEPPGQPTAAPDGHAGPQADPIGDFIAATLGRPLARELDRHLADGQRAEQQLAEVKQIVYRWATSGPDPRVQAVVDLLNDLARALELSAADTDRHLAEQPVRHAPGRAVRCPACRAKGHTVCTDAATAPEPAP